MTFHQIFPEIVYQARINDYELIKEKFASKIINRYKASSDEKAPWATLCNTWQVNADEQINQLFTDYFQEHVYAWFKEFCFPRVDFKVASWVNVHTWESYQETHYHMGDHCILCGTYNLQLNKKDSSLEMDNFTGNTSIVDTEEPNLIRDEDSSISKTSSYRS